MIKEFKRRKARLDRLRREMLIGKILLYISIPTWLILFIILFV
jgi:hypothetical protein